MLTEARWAATPADPMPGATVGSALLDLARTRPDAPALHWLDDGLRTRTFGELAADAERLARWLAARVERGTLAICAASSVDWIVGELAAALAGWTLVPVNPRVGDDELAHLVRLTAPDVVLADAALTGRFVDALDVATVGDLAGDGVLPAVHPDDRFLVQPTSGTTGRAKGAVHTHRGVLAAAALWCADWDHGPDDVLLGPVPMHHVGGSVCTLLSVLASGAPLAFVDRWDPGRVIDLAEATGTTVLAAVPTMLFDLQRQPGFAPERLRALRVIAGGGSAVSPDMIRALEATFGATFVVSYGQSEAPSTLNTPATATVEQRATTIGRPLPGRDVRIARDDGTTAALGEVGEILVRSPFSMKEYLGMPAETAAAIDPDGWLHSGDVGSMDADGYVTFRGRSRDVVIRGGENVYPAEVEAAYASHPAVTAVAVVGQPDERLGEVPVGIVVGAGLTESALVAWGRDRLTTTAVPRRWYAATELPLTASGKVRSFVLQELVADGRLDRLPA